MKKYQTKQLDKILNEFLWYDEALKEIESIIGNYDQEDEIEEITSLMYSKLSGFKRKLGKAINEIKLNLVQIDENALTGYISYCKIKTAGLKNFRGPDVVFKGLHDRKVDDIGDYLRIKEYSLVPSDPHDYYNLSFFLYSYSILFKIFAEALVGICDSQFMKYNWDIRNISSKPVPKESIRKKTNSFRFNNKSELDLEHFCKYFNIHIDFIDSEKTSPADFVAVFTSKDFSKEAKPIYLNCETVQFIYLISKLRKYFDNLNPTSIEESKLFYSKNSVLLNKSNLYKNKISNPKKQRIIDDYFKNLQK